MSDYKGEGNQNYVFNRRFVGYTEDIKGNDKDVPIGTFGVSKVARYHSGGGSPGVKNAYAFQINIYDGNSKTELENFPWNTAGAAVCIRDSTAISNKNMGGIFLQSYESLGYVKQWWVFGFNVFSLNDASGTIGAGPLKSDDLLGLKTDSIYEIRVFSDNTFKSVWNSDKPTKHIPTSLLNAFTYDINLPFNGPIVIGGPASETIGQKSIKIAEIVGISVGALVAVALVLFILFYLLKKPRIPYYPPMM